MPIRLGMGGARHRLQPGGASPQDVVERIRIIGRPSGLRCNQLDAERVRDPARDLGLQGEEIASVAVEPLCP